VDFRQFGTQEASDPIHLNRRGLRPIRNSRSFRTDSSESAWTSANSENIEASEPIHQNRRGLPSIQNTRGFGTDSSESAWTSANSEHIEASEPIHQNQRGLPPIQNTLKLPHRFNRIGVNLRQLTAGYDFSELIPNPFILTKGIPIISKAVFY